MLCKKLSKRVSALMMKFIKSFIKASKKPKIVAMKCKILSIY